MVNNDNNALSIFLGAFIVILIGVVLLNSIANSITAATTISSQTNESITIGATGNGTTGQDDVTGISYFGNASCNTVNPLCFVIDASVNWTSTGFIQTNTTGDLYNISYTYEGEAYLTDSTSRTLITLVILFFALSIVAVGYFLVVKSYNNINL